MRLEVGILTSDLRLMTYKPKVAARRAIGTEGEAFGRRNACPLGEEVFELFHLFLFGSGFCLGLLLFAYLVEHAAFASENGTGLDGELVDEDVAFDAGSAVEG